MIWTCTFPEWGRSEKKIRCRIIQNCECPGLPGVCLPSFLRAMAAFWISKLGKTLWNWWWRKSRRTTNNDFSGNSKEAFNVSPGYWASWNSLSCRRVARYYLSQRTMRNTDYWSKPGGWLGWPWRQILIMWMFGWNSDFVPEEVDICYSSSIVHYSMKEFDLWYLSCGSTL